MNSAIAITTQKIVCASVACAVEIAHGRKNSTVSPPSTPCPMTAASAIQPSTFIHLRCSTRCVQTAITMISRPMNSANMRWPCSYFTPPTMGGILYSEPNEVGQSGTDRPASLLVTSAPARSAAASRRQETPQSDDMPGCTESSVRSEQAPVIQVRATLPACAEPKPL